MKVKNRPGIEAWLVIGVVGFILGIIESFGVYFRLLSNLNFTSFTELSYRILSALSGGVIYFFTFAAIFYLLKYKKLDKMWVGFTVAFYILTYIVAFANLENAAKSFLTILFFPLVYGPFFIPFAIDFLTENLVKERTSDWLSLILIIIFNIASFSWFYLEFYFNQIRNNAFASKLKMALLFFIFLMLTIGMVSCVNQLELGIF
ncbi:hypothetical protein HYU12_01230 [Candidatus Woesearchaeota archaeon]|nr:hypothetical protein [Candidatus Woesearchaeota archaeon]